MTTKEKALALADRCVIAMLGNKDSSGNPQIKAIMKAKNNGLREFWFCSNTLAKRTSELERDGNSCLYFYEFETNNGTIMVCRGLMLSGSVEISYDDDLRRSVWKDGYEIYFPQGVLDPGFAIIKFTAETGNYYEGLSNEDFKV